MSFKLNNEYILVGIFFLQLLAIYVLSYMVYEECSSWIMFNWLCFLCTAETISLLITLLCAGASSRNYGAMMIIYSCPAVIILILTIIITNCISPNWWPTVKLLAINSLLILNVCYLRRRQ